MKLVGQGREARRLQHGLRRARDELAPALKVDLADVDPVVLVEVQAELARLASEVAELQQAVQHQLSEAAVRLAKRLRGGSAGER